MINEMGLLRYGGDTSSLIVLRSSILNLDILNKRSLRKGLPFSYRRIGCAEPRR